jgi:hypothetical protein
MSWLGVSLRDELFSFSEVFSLKAKARPSAFFNAKMGI